MLTLMKCNSDSITSNNFPNQPSFDIQSVVPCSGRGDCLNGTCMCEIRYSGDECDSYNIPYHAGVSLVFYFVAALSMIQLFICCVAEYQRLKQPSLLRAIRITTQKLLYFVIFVAAMLRGAYFTTPFKASHSDWASFLISAYYPLLLTCSSLVVCLWAEIFHLRNISATQFLSKSFLGFLAFNILPYSLFGAEILSSHILQNQNYHALINGCYAFLMLIVLIFFLIYGFEVFFKIRGQFVYDCNIQTNFESMASKEQGSKHDEHINLVQVNHARFGLLSQAVMMTIIVAFLASETFGDFWKNKVPVSSRNLHDVIFRLFEVGFALWFPCCLWNSITPEQLWILNPRKLLYRRIEPVSLLPSKNENMSPEEGRSFLIYSSDCWICYDSDRMDPLIQPCKCTGDVSSVHHECLRRWLAESCGKSREHMTCKVCSSPYKVEETNRIHWERGFTINHCVKIFLLLIIILITAAFAWMIIHAYTDPIVRVLTAGIAILIGYICIKLLGENTVIAYQRALISSLNIINNPK